MGLVAQIIANEKRKAELRRPGAFIHGSAAISGKLDETKPLSGLCPSLDLAKGRVVVASKRQLGPILGPVMFCNTCRDGNPAGLVNKAVRHGCLLSIQSTAHTEGAIGSLNLDVPFAL